jgi:hypothetical protein
MQAFRVKATKRHLGATIMALQTFNFPADPATGAPGGEYVPSAVAAKIEETLSKLVWTVLYGKTHAASSAAVSAEQMLARIKAGEVVAE